MAANPPPDLWDAELNRIFGDESKGVSGGVGYKIVRDTRSDRRSTDLSVHHVQISVFRSGYRLLITIFYKYPYNNALMSDQ